MIYFYCIYIFSWCWQPQQQKEREGNTAIGIFGNGTSTIMSHCSPKAIMTVIAPVTEDNIGQGQGNQLHPKWAHVLQISCPWKERVLKWLNLAVCAVTINALYQKERAKWLCKCLLSSFRKLHSGVSGWSRACLHMVRLERAAAGNHPALLQPS